MEKKILQQLDEDFELDALQEFETATAVALEMSPEQFLKELSLLPKPIQEFIIAKTKLNEKSSLAR